MRELDWRIHEYMGNDLTGCIPTIDGHAEWQRLDDKGRLEALGVKYIPHYSTTWEGAGLVMEWINKSEDMTLMILAWSNSMYRVSVGGHTVVDASAPLSLAKAYISAMEERDNG